EKPEKKGRKKKPGCTPGHEGHCRAQPDHMDRAVPHRESHGPDGGGKLTKCHVSRPRYIEDLPQEVHVEVTEHTIPRDVCPRCRQRVEPKVPEALPNATIGNRLLGMSAREWTTREARRLVKRLRRQQQELFTLVREHQVPFENNFAERIIRRAGLLRKNSFNHRSDKGASTQAILRSVFTTLKQRGLHPIKIVEQALRIYITTGKLPALKDFTPAQP
ncbi:MAG: transposase, partial [Phycisphaerae bacterium]|nr:transposase [Phycisphaerae bacterium]